MAPTLDQDSSRRPLVVLGARALRGRFRGTPDPVLFTFAACLASPTRGRSVLHLDAGAADANLAATARLLEAVGAPLSIAERLDGAHRVRVPGLPALGARTLLPIGDTQLALPALLVALVVPDSEVRIDNMPMRPQTGGALAAPEEMGGDIGAIAGRGRSVLCIRRRGGRLGGGAIAAGDPVVSAAMLVFGLAAQGEVIVEDAGAGEATFPGPIGGLEGPGAEFDWRAA